MGLAAAYLIAFFLGVQRAYQEAVRMVVAIHRGVALEVLPMAPQETNAWMEDSSRRRAHQQGIGMRRRPRHPQDPIVGSEFHPFPSSDIG